MSHQKKQFSNFAIFNIETTYREFIDVFRFIYKKYIEEKTGVSVEQIIKKFYKNEEEQLREYNNSHDVTRLVRPLAFLNSSSTKIVIRINNIYQPTPEIIEKIKNYKVKTDSYKNIHSILRLHILETLRNNFKSEDFNSRSYFYFQSIIYRKTLEKLPDKEEVYAIDQYEEKIWKILKQRNIAKERYWALELNLQKLGMWNKQFRGFYFRKNNNILLIDFVNDLIRFYQIKNNIDKTTGYIALDDFFNWLRKYYFDPFDESGDIFKGLVVPLLYLHKHTKEIKLEKIGDIGSSYQIGGSSYSAISFNTLM